MSASRRPLLVRLLLTYFESAVPNYAAGLAFNAFLTMFPIVLGLLSILGFVLHDPPVYRSIEAVVVQAFPPETQSAVKRLLSEAQRNAGTIALLSVVGLVYAGTGLFASLEFALDHIYGVRPRHPVRQRISGLRLILVFAVALVLAVALNAGITFINGELLSATAYLNVVAGWLVITYLLFCVYRFVPNRAMTVREVLPGAIGAGALIEVLTLSFPLLFDLTHRASAYTQTFTLLLVLATWLYLMSQLALLGALLNRLLADERRSGAGVPALQETAPIAVHEAAEAARVEAHEIRR